MKRIFLSVVLLMVIFVCCKKPAPDNKTTNAQSVSKIYKDFFVYKTGTYWVFQDSLSGLNDSVYVTSYSIALTTAPHWGTVGEVNTTKIKSSYFGDSSKIQMIFYYPYQAWYLMGNFNAPEDNQNISMTFTLPPLDSSYGAFQGDTFISFKGYQTLFLNGQTIDSVSKFYHNKLGAFSHNSTVPGGFIYFRKHLFIVRREFFWNGILPHQIWILKRWHIVQ